MEVPKEQMLQTLLKIDGKFAHSVKKRKNQLVAMLRNSAQPQEVYTLITEKTKNLEKFLKAVEADATEKPQNPYRLESFFPKERRVCFRNTKQSQVFFTDYLAFRYYDLYIVNDISIDRYVHFEIYFDKSILSVLMKKSAYNSRNRGFAEFDLDSQEWFQLKLQMQMWNQWYRPDVKTVDKDATEGEKITKFLKEKSHKALSDQETESVLMLFRQEGVPWELFAWLIMVQMQYCKSDHLPLTLLNIKCNSPTEIIDRLQVYVSALSLNSEQEPEDICFTTQEPTDVQYHNQESKIYIALCQKPRDYQTCIRFLSKFQGFRQPNLVPILVGNNSVWENNIWNIDISENEFNHAKIGLRNNPSLLRKLILYNLQSIAVPNQKEINFWEKPFEKQIWNRTYKAYKNWHKDWKKWAEYMNFDFIPPEYFQLAAWICVALYGKKCEETENSENSKSAKNKKTKKSINNKIEHSKNDLEWLKNHLKDIEHTRQNEWNQYRIFFTDLLKNIENYTRESPGPSDLKKADTPFLKSYEGDGECIIFSQQLFKAYTNDKYGEGSGRIILDVSKEKGYLRHSKDRDTIAYRFPKDKVENGKSETAQVYAFIVDKINNETDT